MSRIWYENNIRVGLIQTDDIFYLKIILLELNI